MTQFQDDFSVCRPVLVGLVKRFYLSQDHRAQFLVIRLHSVSTLQPRFHWTACCLLLFPPPVPSDLRLSKHILV